MGHKFGVRWKYASVQEAAAAKKAQELAYYERCKAMRAQIRARDFQAEWAALQERERATTAPRTLTQELLGDPAFGRSALDRRMSP